MEELKENNIVRILKNLKDDNKNPYIKEVWFNGIDIKNTFTSDLINCINNCTSPRVSEKGKPITEEDLKLIFKAFSLFKPGETRVLILGQDPYPNENKACGLAFLHNRNYNKEIDESLKNILLAIKIANINTQDIKYKSNDDWVSQNKVLLLNTSLTYEKHPNYGKRYQNENEKNTRKKETEEIKIKHQKAWKPFIQQMIIKLLTCDNNKLVVFLWGKDAQLSFIEYINNIEIKKNIRIFSCYHPTPKNENNKENLDENLLFSKAAPKQFELCNLFLKENDVEEIDWKGLLKIYTEK